MCPVGVRKTLAASVTTDRLLTVRNLTLAGEQDSTLVLPVSISISEDFMYEGDLTR